MRVRFFGTGNAFADGGRAHSCVQIECPGVSLLLDCGSSAFPAIQRASAADGIDAVAVSHLHGDHFGGIPYLVLQQHFAGRIRPLTLAGPRDLAARIGQLEQALYPDFFGKVALRFELRFVTLGEDPTPLGPASVTASPVRHIAESDPHGLRVRVGDRVVAYSGDATWSNDLASVARGADLFICEATNYERDDASHISYRTLVAHRGELDCARIVLTHLGAETLAHASELTLEHATDGLSIDL